MRSDLDPACQPVYEAARRFEEVALRRDGSLFEPDRSVWSAGVLDDLHARFVLAPDPSSDSFEEKLRRQLTGAPAATIQLAAELLFVHFLVAHDIGEVTKRHLVDLVRSWCAEPISVPADLELAFATGVCSTGIAFKTYRPLQLYFLIDFMRAWKELAGSERDRLLKDAWEFKDFAESIPQKAAFTQRQGFVHLLFPHTFEDMVSRDQKALIIKSLGAGVLEPLSADPDRALAQIRAQLEPEFGKEFAFWDSPIAERWRPRPMPPAPPGQEAGRRAWLIRGTEEGKSVVPEWLSGGYCSIGWPELGELPTDIDRAALMERLKATYPDSTDGTSRNSAGIILRFLQAMHPNDVVLAPNGADLYLGIIDGPVEYRSGDVHPWRRPVEWANVGGPIARSSVSASLYSKLRTLLTLTEISENLAEMETFIGPAPERPPLEEIEFPVADSELEARLHVPADWLNEQLALLHRRRQLVLYGPPGTGKTFIAQALADHMTSHGGTVMFVQFHPGYSYEDFFEGYRPRTTGGGTIGFELVPGPLRRLADAARSDRTHAYVLVIDEINRANVAKVFGELYFLLEYRDRSISLQYSGEDDLFQLPSNLFVIGTMNTVDRSIALVDAALRRRFFFTALFPDRKPISEVLPSWLEAHHLPQEPALILKALNERLGDSEAAIGPSYFMEEDISEEKVLRRIWDHSIIPQLEEYHFGTGVVVAERYDLEAIRRSIVGTGSGTPGFASGREP